MIRPAFDARGLTQDEVQAKLEQLPLKSQLAILRYWRAVYSKGTRMRKGTPLERCKRALPHRHLDAQTIVRAGYEPSEWLLRRMRVMSHSQRAGKVKDIKTLIGIWDEMPPFAKEVPG